MPLDCTIDLSELEDDETRVLKAILDYLLDYGFKSEQTTTPYQARLTTFNRSEIFAVLTIHNGQAILRSYARQELVLRQPLADPDALDKLLVEVERCYMFRPFMHPRYSS